MKLPSLGLRHRRKITGSHFGCLFLFVKKILKPNAFRHTISEGILNLLEGSDAIYGVIVTRHAADRMRERGGLNRKSIQRIANQVYFNGYPIERTKGRLRKWMYKISKSNPKAIIITYNTVDTLNLSMLALQRTRKILANANFDAMMNY